MTTLTYPTWEEQVTAWNEFTKGSFGGEWKAPMIGPETPTFMGLPHAERPEQLEGMDAVIIGAPYVASKTEKYAGVDRREWLAAPQRVRQQSIRYQSGYIQDFDLDVFEHIDAVDYGDADIPQEILDDQSPEAILRAQAAVAEKVGRRAGRRGGAGSDRAELAVWFVRHREAHCGAYGRACGVHQPRHSLGRTAARSPDPRSSHRGGRQAGRRRCTSSTTTCCLSTSWRSASGECWRRRRSYASTFAQAARFISSWEVRTSLGIEGLVAELDRAYQGTETVYAHFDMDVMGGAGPAPGDLLGEAVEPIALTDYEIIRIAHEIGKRGLSGLSFICIPPGSAVTYRVVVYVIMYMLAGLAMRKRL